MLPVEFPLYFKVHDRRGNGGYPESFPFHLYFDEDLNMYRQSSGPALNDILKSVYETGTLVDGSLSNESGKIYLDKMVAYIAEAATDLSGKKVLEIGCGSGLLLKHLKELGADVLGVEPGAHKPLKDIGDIRIIRDFFPTKQIDGDFDIIIHHGVLEHIEDPISFLSIQKKYLRREGRMIISVPNCEPFLATGDLSIFIHEHFNYFTRQSLDRVIGHAGFTVLDLQVFEGFIFAVVGHKGFGPNKLISSVPFDNEKFEDQVSSFTQKVKAELAGYNSEETAIYVPFRAMNALFVAGIFDTRLVDDNSEVTGSYIPCFEMPIEDFSSLRQRPPKCILIYSRTFGDRIKQKCLAEPAFQFTKILTLDELD